LYNRLKTDEIHSLFYKDYLSGEKLDKWLAKEILENEDHIDFKNKISEKDYEQLLSDINEGYSNGDLTMMHIVGMTDAHIGDCSF
jgi:vacuolar-type H+-ATPase subunit C/Vma6